MDVEALVDYRDFMPAPPVNQNRDQQHLQRPGDDDVGSRDLAMPRAGYHRGPKRGRDPAEQPAVPGSPDFLTFRGWTGCVRLLPAEADHGHMGAPFAQKAAPPSHRGVVKVMHQVEQPHVRSPSTSVLPAKRPDSR